VVPVGHGGWLTTSVQWELDISGCGRMEFTTECAGNLRWRSVANSVSPLVRQLLGRYRV